MQGQGELLLCWNGSLSPPPQLRYSLVLMNLFVVALGACLWRRESKGKNSLHFPPIDDMIHYRKSRLFEDIRRQGNGRQQPCDSTIAA
jgi:hypothetical protein